MVNLDELENEAKYVIPEAAYYYIASGAENEWTWRNNTALTIFKLCLVL